MPGPPKNNLRTNSVTQLTKEQGKAVRRANVLPKNLLAKLNTDEMPRGLMDVLRDMQLSIERLATENAQLRARLDLFQIDAVTPNVRLG